MDVILHDDMARAIHVVKVWHLVKFTVNLISETKYQLMAKMQFLMADSIK